ncbi:hypothetical protein [Paenarthrobacter sp. Z7-10]|uniref:hypothetical protein n=1 Tax=Paenarthrobacter sp. Z7-10 TaxID=2787635 RepID=UPI0022A90A90|nr:hypothetical protein [Paenarthrobacter sp. Z7-10]
MAEADAGAGDWSAAAEDIGADAEAIGADAEAIGAAAAVVGLLPVPDAPQPLTSSTAAATARYVPFILIGIVLIGMAFHLQRLIES